MNNDMEISSTSGDQTTSTGSNPADIDTDGNVKRQTGTDSPTQITSGSIERRISSNPFIIGTSPLSG